MDRPLTLGVDPAIRHTGLCLLGEAEPIFMQVDTEQNHPMVESVRLLRRETAQLLLPYRHRIGVLGMERQLSVGGQSSSSQYLAQITLLEVILGEIEGEPKVVMPLPIQLYSYAHHKLGFVTTNKTSIVRSFKEKTGFEGRISSHCVDGWLAATLAEDVIAGNWKYKLPSKEVAPFGGEIVNG